MVKAPAAKRQKTGAIADEDVHEFPWLAELDISEGFHCREDSTTQSSASSGTSASVPTELDDELWAMAQQKLENARLALAKEEEVSHSDFSTRVLGGAWLLKTKGIPFDAIQGAARNELAKEFCGRRLLQKTMRFDYNVYGGEHCGVLARAWCHRMQWLLNLELSLTVKPNEAFQLKHMQE